MSIIGKRNLYYDFLRGISILLVVAIHTSKLPEIFNDITDYCALGIFQIAMVAVPVFLVISGFFLSEKKLDSKDEIVSFWKKQIPKVYVPMLIWALPIVLLQIVNGKNPLFSIFSWVTGGIGANYFVILIIQCYLLLPLLKNIKWGGVIGLFTIGCLYQGLMVYHRMTGDSSIPILIYLGLFPKLGFYFTMGICLKKHPLQYKMWPLILLASILLILCVIESSYWYGIEGENYDSNLTSFLFVPVVILILFHPSLQRRYNKSGIINQLILFMGSISFGVYLTHMFFGKTILARFIKIENWLGDWLCVIIFTTLMIMIIRKLIPAIANKYLGLYRN